ncbi:hypothetical protein [Flavobacterium sp. GSB-24]|uniref:hypothetical protein n=1 Tax=Flavobacterium sp. GSB-24 TaxID=2994319 RepID=UPI0024922DCC|nr:hypothetical protein [Flavobacterium sp. GSB-24]BDU26937.1 hypothetical protein FLGSB24_36810 [Flavobacterium sp. GSB-24]
MREMFKEKILVHDSSNGFLRFIRNHYCNKFTVEVNKNKKEFSLRNVKEYSFGFININDYNDLIYVKFIESKVKFLLIVSTKSEFNQLKFDADRVLFLDSFSLKSEILKQIDFGINSLA